MSHHSVVYNSLRGFQPARIGRFGITSDSETTVVIRIREIGHLYAAGIRIFGVGAADRDAPLIPDVNGFQYASLSGDVIQGIRIISGCGDAFDCD